MLTRCLPACLPAIRSGNYIEVCACASCSHIHTHTQQCLKILYERACDMMVSLCIIMMEMCVCVCAAYAKALKKLHAQAALQM